QDANNAIGTVAGRGLYKGVSQTGDFEAGGLLVWLMDLAYRGDAIPTVDRKIKVFGNWFFNAGLGRDSMPLADLDVPREIFVEAANSKPAPKKEAAKA